MDKRNLTKKFSAKFFEKKFCVAQKKNFSEKIFFKFSFYEKNF